MAGHHQLKEYGQRYAQLVDYFIDRVHVLSSSFVGNVVGNQLHSGDTYTEQDNRPYSPCGTVPWFRAGARCCLPMNDEPIPLVAP